MSYKVFPAPAGINRRNGTRNRQEARVPRASGDKPQSTGAEPVQE